MFPWGQYCPRSNKVGKENLSLLADTDEAGQCVSCFDRMSMMNKLMFIEIALQRIAKLKSEL